MSNNEVVRYWRWLIVFSPLLLTSGCYALMKIPIDDLQPLRKFALHEDAKYWNAGAPPFLTDAPMEMAQIDVTDAPNDLVDRFRKTMKSRGWSESASAAGTGSGIQFENGSSASAGWISIEPDVNRDGSPNWRSFRALEFRSLSSSQIWLLRLRKWKWQPLDTYFAAGE